MEIHSRAALAAVLGTSLLAASGSAQDAVVKDPRQGRFSVNLNDPEANLPSQEEANKYPLDWGYLLMELDERAQAAALRNDWRSAIKFHRAAAKLTPDRAISYALLCNDYEKAGERSNAVDACFKSLNLDGSKIEYFVRFVQLVAARPGGTDPDEVDKALQAIAHLKSNPAGELAGYEMQCELSVRTASEDGLAECSKELIKRQPHSPRAISFAWALAVQRKDFARARRLIRDAKRDGATPAAVARMQEATDAAEQGGPSGSAPLAPAHQEPPAPPTPPPAAAVPSTHSTGGEHATVASSLAPATASASLHPMLRWLIGLTAALMIVIPVARRIAAPRRSA